MCDWLNDEHTTVDIAKVLGVTRQALTRYRKRGLPVGPGGGHPLAASVAWFVRHEIAKASPSDADSALKESRKKLLDLEYARRRGELISLTDAQRSWRECITEARGILEGLPSRVIADVSPEGKYNRDEVEGVVRERVSLTLRSLARGTPSDAAPLPVVDCEIEPDDIEASEEEEVQDEDSL